MGEEGGFEGVWVEEKEGGKEGGCDEWLVRGVKGEGQSQGVNIMETLIQGLSLLLPS